MEVRAAGDGTELPALLIEAEIMLASVGVEILPLKLGDRASTGSRVYERGDHGPVPDAGEVRLPILRHKRDGLEKFTHLLRIHRRCLPLRDRVLWATHREGGVQGNRVALHELVEEVTECCEVQFPRGLARGLGLWLLALLDLHVGRERFDVLADEGWCDLAQWHTVLVAVGEEPMHRVPVCTCGVLRVDAGEELLVGVASIRTGFEHSGGHDRGRALGNWNNCLAHPASSVESTTL